MILVAARRKLRRMRRPSALRPGLALYFFVFIQLLNLSSLWAEAPKVMGSWSTEVTFQNGEHRKLQVEAQPDGKASFQLAGLRPSMAGNGQPAAAEWTRGNDGSVSFSGPVQFPLGNVGIDRGTLVLKGKFEADGSLAGQAIFYRAGRDQSDPEVKPAKCGSFRATRKTGGLGVSLQRFRCHSDLAKL